MKKVLKLIGCNIFNINSQNIYVERHIYFLCYLKIRSNRGFLQTRIMVFMKINNYNIRRKGLEPLIATILLIVVSVILVTIVLTWGKEFSTSSLNKTNNFAELKASDATHFIYPKSAQEGIIQFTYSPPAQISNDINITHYRVINIPEMTEPVALSEPKILSPSLNILELPCLYEYSTTTPDLYIQLITADNTYIDIKTKDPGMVCTSGGTGTEENPIIVCNAEDLNNVRNDLDANYSLGKDIDLQCFSRQNVNGWSSIGNVANKFIGKFDGQNHKIKKLYIYRPTTDYIGLFGYMASSSILQNMKLEDVNISGYDRVGGLAGKSIGVVNNVFTSGKITGYTNVGGIAGENVPIGTVMSKCNSSADVNGYSRVGGLVGNNDSALIQTSYATGIITGTTYVGGFVGLNELGSAVGTILSSYSIGSVSGDTNYGGFAGYNDSGSILSSFWDMNTSGQITSAGGVGVVGKTTTEMKTQSTFTSWDFSSIWAISSSTNDGYPYLRNNPPR